MRVWKVGNVPWSTLIRVLQFALPSDVIIDASMPAAIRESGKMWGADGALHDMKAVILIAAMRAFTLR